MKKGKKKQWLIVLVLAIVVVAAICVGGWKHAQKTAFSLTINGTQISEEEYIQCMKSVRYDTKMELESENGNVSGDELWTATYENGKTGYEILAEKTVDELKRMHVIYDIAKEKGYIEDATYEGMLSRMEQENKLRSEKVARGEVVYGLKEYSTDLYQEYELSMIEEKYILDENNEGMDLTEDEIEEYYNSRDWIVGEEARKADLSEARAAVVDEMRRTRYADLTEGKAKVAEVDGDMENISQFTLKQL